MSIHFVPRKTENPESDDLAPAFGFCNAIAISAVLWALLLMWVL